MTSNEFKENQGRLARLSEEERKEIARKGGLATQEKIRKRKSIKEMADIMLSCELNGEGREAVKKMFPELEEDEITYAAYIVFGQIMAAVGEGKGNAKAFEKLIELQDYRTPEDDEKDRLTIALEEAAKKL